MPAPAHPASSSTPATSAIRPRSRRSRMRRTSSAGRLDGFSRRTRITPTSSPTRTSLRFRTSWRGPRTASTPRAATITRRCAAITRASAPSPTRSAPRSSTAPSRRCRSKRRPPPRPRRASISTPRAEVARVFAVLWLALFALASPAAAQHFPPLTGRVVDQAHLLRPEQVVDLTSKSEALEAQSGRQFVVATIPSLQGYPIEEYGPLLGRAWGIGQKASDNGVILIVAPNEHRVRIEVGYGAGGFLTDAVSGEIIRNTIVPHFKQSPPDYGGGIEAGADEIIKQKSLSPEEAQKNIAAAEQAQQQRQHSSAGVLPAFFWFMIFAFVLLSMLRRAGGRRYRRRKGGISPWVVLWGLNEL